MSDALFREGGPHRIRRTGKDQFEARVSLPPDEDGFLGRRCPNAACAPGYFKVATEVETRLCPYCAEKGGGESFHTEEQIRYAKELLTNEAMAGVRRLFSKSLGLSPHSGRRTLGGGLFKVEMKLEPARPKFVRRPLEEELRRDLSCPSCGARHAVFGLANWCPGCGADTFLAHVAAELNVLRQVLGENSERRVRLGARAAARDIENVLEDLVSTFEAVCKLVVRRALARNGMPTADIEALERKEIKNTFQSVPRGRDLAKKLLGIDPFNAMPESDVDRLRRIFEMRHPITHNLGVVDRKYLEQVQSAGATGREIRVPAHELLWAIDRVQSTVATCHRAVFGATAGSVESSGET